MVDSTSRAGPGNAALLTGVSNNVFSRDSHAMASSSILQRLQAEFDSPPEWIEAVVALLEEGAPVQFISRFRRDETGDLGEDRIQTIDERLHFLQELETRKEAIRQQAGERNALTDELKQNLDTCFDQDLLDDIFQSFRPRRRSAAAQAEERGVGPLALAIQHRQLGERSLLEVAKEYISEEKGLPTPEAVLEATLIILSDRHASDPALRAKFRDELSRGVMKATATAPDHKRAQRYKQFFDFEEPVRRISAHRMLALRRAEREGILQLQLCLPEDRKLEIFRERLAADLPEGSILRQFSDLVFQYCYDHTLRRECEAVIRRRIKEKADRETVRATRLGKHPLQGQHDPRELPSRCTFRQGLRRQLRIGTERQLGRLHPRRARPNRQQTLRLRGLR